MLQLYRDICKELLAVRSRQPRPTVRSPTDVRNSAATLQSRATQEQVASALLAADSFSFRDLLKLSNPR